SPYPSNAHGDIRQGAVQPPNASDQRPNSACATMPTDGLIALRWQPHPGGAGASTSPPPFRNDGAHERSMRVSVFVPTSHLPGGSDSMANGTGPRGVEGPPGRRDGAVQNTAIGFSGEPVPPGTRSGAARKRNS